MNKKLFRHRNFMLLIQGKFVSSLGTNLQTFALSLYVLNTYESASLFASILMISFIPRILLSPFAGVLVDWMDRKKIIVSLDLLSGALVVLLGGLYYSQNTLPLWSIYAIAISLSLINVLFDPAISTVIPAIIEEEDLFSANTINQLTYTFANILGPILGGILIGFYGIGPILLVNGLSFFLSALSEVFITIPVLDKPNDKAYNLTSFKVDLKEGFTFLKGQSILLKVMLLSLILNFFLAPMFSVAIPYILKKVLLVSDQAFGLFESLVVGASILGMMAAGKVSQKFTLEKILFWDVLTQPLVIFLIALLSTNFVLKSLVQTPIPFALLTLLCSLLIIVITIGNIAFGTMMQKQIPLDKMGRVMTIMSTLSMGAVPLGQGLMGLLLDRMSPVIPLLFSTLALALAVGLTKSMFEDGSLNQMGEEQSAA